MQTDSHTLEPSFVTRTLAWLLIVSALMLACRSEVASRADEVCARFGAEVTALQATLTSLRSSNPDDRRGAFMLLAAFASGGQSELGCALCAAIRDFDPPETRDVAEGLCRETALQVQQWVLPLEDRVLEGELFDAAELEQLTARYEAFRDSLSAIRAEALQH